MRNTNLGAGLQGLSAWELRETISPAFLQSQSGNALPQQENSFRLGRPVPAMFVREAAASLCAAARTPGCKGTRGSWCPRTRASSRRWSCLSPPRQTPPPLRGTPPAALLPGFLRRQGGRDGWEPWNPRKDRGQPQAADARVRCRSCKSIAIFLG